MDGNRFAIDKTLSTEDGIRLHYRDWGGRGWPVLLLHGLSSTSHIWDLVAPLLVDDARVVALDLRGHGQSDKPDGRYSYDEIGGDVFDVISELEMDNPVVVGHSYGANVGMWVSARDMDALAGLIMVDGGMMDMSDMTWQQTAERLTPAKIGGMPIDNFREMLRSRTPQGFLSPAVEAAILANFEIHADSTIHRRLPREYHMRILRAAWEFRLTSLYEQVTCPVLLLPCRQSEVDDQDVLTRKEEGVKRVEAKLPDVETIWLEDTVHDAPLQRPNLLAREIIRFLRERV